jgi:hypothetical protein
MACRYDNPMPELTLSPMQSGIFEFGYCTSCPSYIELFVEDQTFSPSYDFASLSAPRLPSPVSKSSLFLSLPMCRRSRLLTGEGEEGAKSYHGEKAWSSRICYILSEWTVPLPRKESSRRVRLYRRCTGTGSFLDTENPRGV